MMLSDFSGTPRKKKRLKMLAKQRVEQAWDA